jgi:hypothetical protein
MVAGNLRLARSMTNCRSNSIQNTLGACNLMMNRSLVAKWINLQTVPKLYGENCDINRAGQIRRLTFLERRIDLMTIA